MSYAAELLKDPIAGEDYTRWIKKQNAQMKIKPDDSSTDQPVINLQLF
jgi:hypothetical protein